MSKTVTLDFDTYMREDKERADLKDKLATYQNFIQHVEDLVLTPKEKEAKHKGTSWFGPIEATWVPLTLDQIITRLRGVFSADENNTSTEGSKKS